jgi:predicted nucleic acid-binding protein
VADSPHPIDAEVGSVLHRLVSRGVLPADQASSARRDAELAIGRRHRHAGQLGRRAWELREKVGFYDGLYVALAEQLDAPWSPRTLDWPGPPVRAAPSSS